MEAFRDAKNDLTDGHSLDRATISSYYTAMHNQVFSLYISSNTQSY
jgi:hypothetical protein